MAEEKKNVSLTEIISTAIQIPGVKVNREAFLRDTFKGKSDAEIDAIISVGAVEAGCGREELKKIAEKLIDTRTAASSMASFAAGLPGGFTMAVTIPADILQFYGVALRMAQELAYLYGEPDLWAGGRPDSEKVTNQLILYCGAMMGATGAAQVVRILASALAEQIAKKLPQKALTKTLYYPIVKSIAKAFSVKMTKGVFAKGVSKAIPIIGGVVSGGLTLVTMRPMGFRLLKALDEAHFAYTENTFEADWKAVVEISEEVKKEDEADVQDDLMTKIERAKGLLDKGTITEEEFEKIKARLIEKATQ